MHRFSLSNAARTGIAALSFSLMVSALPVSAQNSPDPGTAVDNNTNAPGERALGESGDRDFDWGWLGLLGLIGLAGLRGRQEPEGSVHYRDPNTTEGRTGLR